MFRRSGNRLAGENMRHLIFLAIHGTADEIALKPNAESIYDSLTAAPKRDLIWIEGAKHYLTPGWIAETYAKRITEWVGADMPARVGGE
jgi:fermentation-respiration switch protein FrsA (DUF1100 family)